MQKIDLSSSIEENVNLCYRDCKITTVDYNNLSYNEFFCNFMNRNWPCIIKNINSSWECSKKWLKNNEIDYQYFIREYGSLVAPVADCEKIEFNAQNKVNMKVEDFFNYLLNLQRDKLLYLKDWHLKKLRPHDNFYNVPHFFESDWLNEYALDHDEDDFMFVYIGPKDSWTPFHCDVYSSFSWSVNVKGQKRWHLFPPGEEEKIKDSLGNYPIFFKDSKEKNYHEVNYFEVIQDAGDALFVPSGWHHQVTNIVDTISINHNWVNGCNIEQVYSSLLKNLASVENEIKDLKDTDTFPNQCQLILKSIFGMDFEMFVNFITYIGEKRLLQVKNEGDGVNNYLGFNHIMFDLKKILKIMCLIQEHPFVSNNFLAPNVHNRYFETKTLISNLINFN